MKILILNWRDVRHPRAGGADFRLQQVYAPLVRAGHKVVLYSCAFNGELRGRIRLMAFGCFDRGMIGRLRSCAH